MLIDGLIDLIFPKVCSSCECSLLSGEQILCTKCRMDLPVCNWQNYRNNLITDKLKGRINLAYADALFYFEKGNKAQALIHDLKYKGQEHISDYLGKWHAENLKTQEWIKSIDVVLPVPIHAKRRRQRGYNQVKGYAKAICKAINCEYNDSLLKREHYSRTQVFKNRLARTNVIEHNFILNHTEHFNAKHIVLVDDLITTGATAEACFLQLSRLGNVKLSLLVMAVVP